MRCEVKSLVLPMGEALLMVRVLRLSTRILLDWGSPALFFIQRTLGSG